MDPDPDTPLVLADEWAWTVTRLSDITWPRGASATPPQVVADGTRHVDPAIILCAQPDHLLGNAWGDSLQTVALLADQSGIERAVQGICEDNRGSLPVILTVDLGGAAMHNLIHSIWMCGRDARILCLATRRVPGTMRTSGLQLPLLAHAQWGARALHYATFLNAVREPLWTGRGSQAAQILAAQFRIWTVRVRTIDPPQCTCAWGALVGEDAGALRVLTPFEAQDTVWALLTTAQRRGQQAGIELHWATETLKPGGALGGGGLGAGGELAE